MIYKFTIDDLPFEWEDKKLSVKKLLEFAQEKRIILKRENLENIKVIGEKKKYNSDDTIDLEVDKTFRIQKIFRIKVNGEEFESKLEKVVSTDIIEWTKEKGASPFPTESSILEVINENIQFKPGDWVDLSKYQEFMIISLGPTPVA